MSDETKALRERIEAMKAQAERAQVLVGDLWGVGLDLDNPRWAFLAAHDPASVIRDCDADLALLDVVIRARQGGNVSAGSGPILDNL